jgi:hypothetical protein
MGEKMSSIRADRLFEFLSELEQTARSHGNSKAAERLEFARKHYIFPLTSEFLGVSMVVLREVLNDATAMLSPRQLQEARKYTERIKEE